MFSRQSKACGEYEQATVCGMLARVFKALDSVPNREKTIGELCNGCLQGDERGRLTEVTDRPRFVLLRRSMSCGPEGPGKAAN